MICQICGPFSLPLAPVRPKTFVRSNPHMRHLCISHPSSSILSLNERYLRVITEAAASNVNELDNQKYSFGKLWDQCTNRLVSFSTIPFSILVLPQVLQNFANISAGNPGALSIISWESSVSYLFGNALMCSHFAHRGELSAVTVQVIGMLNNVAVIAQVAWAQFMPTHIFLLVALLTAASVTVNLLKVQQQLESKALWRGAMMAHGLLGLAAVPQVLYSMIFPTAPSMTPFITALVLTAAWALPRWLPSTPAEPSTPPLQLPPTELDTSPRSGSDLVSSESDQSLSSIDSSETASLSDQVQKESFFLAPEDLPGWTATVVFGLSPLPQIVRNFSSPMSLTGLAPGSVLLGLLGNALMLPRAALTRDLAWMVGAGWAVVASWLQLLSLYFATSSPVIALNCLSAPTFALVTALIIGYVLMTVACDKIARK